MAKVDMLIMDNQGNVGTIVAINEKVIAHVKIDGIFEEIEFEEGQFTIIF